MADSSDIFKSSEPTIQEIGITNDTITGRAGLSLFVRYLRGIDLAPHLERLFGSMRRNRKGLPITAIFKQLLCFFVDGTSSHLVHFDSLRQDDGYAAAIETHLDAMASSHTIKRFFASFSMYRIWSFRRLLQQLFLWRLRVEQPEMIMLGIDAMPMNNTGAKQREGVEPTTRMLLSPAGEYLGDVTLPTSNAWLSQGHILTRQEDEETGETMLLVYRMIPIAEGFIYP